MLIDGGFFIKRLPKVVDEQYRDSAEAVAADLSEAHETLAQDENELGSCP
ncbi:MAG: hypothetical protein OXQ31_00810 [Spirochaetaceae bacterium]|nr:hypothetical protein [Spirochaetaceae bacterium]